MPLGAKKRINDEEKKSAFYFDKNKEATQNVKKMIANIISIIKDSVLNKEIINITVIIHFSNKPNQYLSSAMFSRNLYNSISHFSSVFSFKPLTQQVLFNCSTSVVKSTFSWEIYV